MYINNNIINNLLQEARSFGANSIIYPASHAYTCCLDKTNYIKEITNIECSYGYIIIIDHKVIVFLDSRYLTQYQSNDNIEIKNISTLHNYLSLKHHTIFAFDPYLFSVYEIESFKCEKRFYSTKVINRFINKQKIINMPNHDIQTNYTRAFLKGIENDSIWIITDQADLSWFFGIRNIEDNSLLVNKVAIISNTAYRIFENLSECVDYLKLSDIKFNKIYYDPKKTPYSLLLEHSVKEYLLPGYNEIFKARAIKIEKEIEDLRKVHLQESKAFTELLSYIHNNNNTHTEGTLSNKLEEIREQNDTYIRRSFDTISAFDKNSSCIHYKCINPSKITQGIYLIDAGGQYKYGTTDISRTIIVGREATKEEKFHFTHVLKSFIAIATLHFPYGTNPSQIDTIGRYNMWNIGSSYAHATGHGVGYFLSVHEYPIISSKNDNAILLEGMTIAIEPGFYCNDYGIRIENVFLIKQSDKFNDFLCFDMLDFVPIDQNLIEFSLLNQKEYDWIIDYNKQCS